MGKLWGVGKVTGEALLGRGIRTIGDLRRSSRETLVRTFGAHGEHLHELARGIDDRPVETEREAKSIGHEDTYDHDLRDRGAMRREYFARRPGVVASAPWRDQGEDGHAEGEVPRLRPGDPGGHPVRSHRRRRDDLPLLPDLLLDTRSGSPARAAPRDLGVELRPGGGRAEEGPDGAGSASSAGRARVFRSPQNPWIRRKKETNRAMDRIGEKFGPGGILPEPSPPGTLVGRRRTPPSRRCAPSCRCGTPGTGRAPTWPMHAACGSPCTRCRGGRLSRAARAPCRGTPCTPSRVEPPRLLVAIRARHLHHRGGGVELWHSEQSDGGR